MTEEQKQLVVLAAKAMGFNVYNITDAGAILVFEDDEDMPLWNPLTSDADCFRMETELEITVGYGLTGFTESYKLDKRGYVDIQFYEEIGPDKAAARRLASTRVAAEIGKRNG